MSYGKKRHGSGYGYNKTIRHSGFIPVKHVHKKEYPLGIRTKETTVDYYPVLPSEINEENKTGGSVGVSNGVLGVKGSVEKSNQKTVKFPEKTDT